MYVDVQEVNFLFVIRDLYTFVNCQVTISCHTTQIFCCFYTFIYVPLNLRERSGSMVECLTHDRRAAGLSLTSVTALWSLSKTHLS